MKTLLMLTGSWVLFYTGMILATGGEIFSARGFWGTFIPAAILYTGIYTLVRSIVRDREEES